MSTQTNPVWNWFQTKFTPSLESADAIAVSVTETIKKLLDNGTAGFVTTVIDSATNSKVPDQILSVLQKEVPNILAVELGIQTLTSNPTQYQIQAFETAVLNAFGLVNDKSVLYTTLAAQVYGVIQKTLTTTPGKFFDWVTAVEQVYTDYINDQKTK